MKYTRIYSDADGNSHFEDVSVAVAPFDFAPPAPPLNLAAPIESDHLILCSIPAGWVGEWHPTPRRQFCFQLSGAVEIEVSDGSVRQFAAGSILLLEDTSGRGHQTRALGSAASQTAFVQLPNQSRKTV